MLRIPNLRDTAEVAASVRAAVRKWPVRGYARFALRIAWWNIFGVVAALVFAALLWSDQGKELLWIDDEQSTDAIAILLSVLPLPVYAVLVSLSSMIVARAGTWQLDALAQMFGIDRDRIVYLSRTPIPLLLGILPAALLAIIAGGLKWPLATLVLFVSAIALVRITGRKSRSTIDAGSAHVLPMSRRLVVAVAVALTIAAALAFACSISSTAARAVGSIGVTMVALGFWVGLLTLLFVATPLQGRLSSFALAVPLLWIAVNTFHDPNRFPRAVPDTASASNSARTIPLILAFVEWAAQLPIDPATRTTPVFLVSAEGGGIRAGYWTARTLAELDRQTEGRLARHTFAYSGVSGGSLGIAAFFDVNRRAPYPDSTKTRSLEEFLGRDYLAPLLGHLLISEPFWQFFGAWSMLVPRDVAFERQWNEDWSGITGASLFDRPLLEVWNSSGNRAPTGVFFNSTNVETGKRFVISNLEIEGLHSDYFQAFSTAGLPASLAGISVAEAVHLSARFPYLSPPASLLTILPTSDPNVRVRRLWGRLVDGGYFDNSGGLVIRDVLDRLIAIREDAMDGGARVPDVAAEQWTRIRAVVSRMRFHVIVIRNDPLAGTLREQSDFPTLPAAQALSDQGHDLPSLQASGDLATLLPSAAPLSELLAPVETMLHTRDGRGLATRRALHELILSNGERQVRDCLKLIDQGRTQAGKSGGESRPGCTTTEYDGFHEISLAEMIWNARETRTAAGAPGAAAEHCVDERRRPIIALGWVLSRASRAAMSCYATGSPVVQELAVLFPERPAVRK